MLVPSVLNCYTKVINKLKPEEATHAHVSSLSLSRRKPAALKGEERGAMRMLSKACSIVASSLPRCSAPTVASLSLPLSSRLPFSLDKRWFSAGVWIWDRRASAGARHRDLQLSPCERNNTGVFARETLVLPRYCWDTQLFIHYGFLVPSCCWDRCTIVYPFRGAICHSLAASSSHCSDVFAWWFNECRDGIGLPNFHLVVVLIGSMHIIGWNMTAGSCHCADEGSAVFAAGVCGSIRSGSLYCMESVPCS
jgi:hypothetical protein